MLSFQNHPNATTQDINKFLSQIQIPGWRVHPKLVEFNDPADRDRKASLLYNKYKKKVSKPDSELEWEEVKETVELVLEDLKQADIISSGVHSMRQSGSIAMICGDWERDLAQELGPEENIDHIVLVFLKNRQFSIYDPDWEPSPPSSTLTRLNQLSSLHRVRLFYNKLVAANVRIESIKIGGGGNPDIQCGKMCQELLELMVQGDENALELDWAVESLRS